MTCDDVAELVDELAVDILPGDVRSRVLAHLAGCPSCRTTVEALSATADALLLAAPLVDPPPGFDLRVSHAIQDRQGRAPIPADGAGTLRSIGSGTRRGRVVALVAAAAAVVALL